MSNFENQVRALVSCGSEAGPGATRAALVAPGLHGAFVQDGFGVRLAVAQRSNTLAGLRLAVKDVFDIAGCRMGAGNPCWLEQQPRARSTALAVQLLLESGAHLIGKTVTDELAFSLAGINAYYGSPVNPACPDRIPGGSSSGSVVAVAAGDADIALGTDCGGSCRLPASYCGVWGIRPTQGRIAARGCFSLAHSFDTVGWFARTGEDLAKVFSVLAHTEISDVCDTTVLIPDDALALCDEAVQVAFSGLINRYLAGLNLVHLPAETLALAAWAQAHRHLQGAEIWQQHGTWVNAFGTTLAGDVQQRFASASQVTPHDVARSQDVRVAAAQQLASLFDASSGVLLLPTVPAIAPRFDANADALDEQRARSQQLLCIAGLAGLPQVSFPWIHIDGAPLGLSVIGPRGADTVVLVMAQRLHAMLPQRMQQRRVS